SVNHLNQFRSLIRDDTRWLDVCCGTGYYLSHFPHIERAGLDITPGMIEQARLANPGATFRVGDARDLVEEWRDRWTLVSTTGHGYSYVDTMNDVRRIADNLAAYTAPDGVLFVQVYDMADITGIELPYNFTGERKGN